MTGFIPTYRIYYKDQDVTNRFADRVTDIAVELSAGGGESDSCTITVDDRGWLVSSPQVGDYLSIYLGYEGLNTVFVGRYEVNQVIFSWAPKSIQIRGTISSSLSQLKSTVIENYAGKEVQEILAEAANKAGLKVDIHPSIASEKIEALNHIGSLGSLVARLEKLYGATARITDEKISLIPRGESRSVSDFAQSTWVLTPSALGNVSVVVDSRGDYAKVISSYTDKDTNLRKDIESFTTNSKSKSSAEHRITQMFASEAEARRGGKAVMAQLDRSLGRIHAQMAVGEVMLQPGQRVLIVDSRDGIDGSYLVDLVSHRLSKGQALVTTWSGSAGTDGLLEKYQDSGQNDPAFTRLPAGMTFLQLPRATGTELGQAFGSLPAFALNPPTLPSP